jgi:hypothetical protein
MKAMPNGTRFAAEQTMKYVLWWARRYFTPSKLKSGARTG